MDSCEKGSSSSTNDTDWGLDFLLVIFFRLCSLSSIPFTSFPFPSLCFHFSLMQTEIRTPLPMPSWYMHAAAAARYVSWGHIVWSCLIFVPALIILFVVYIFVKAKSRCDHVKPCKRCTRYHSPPYILTRTPTSNAYTHFPYILTRKPMTHSNRLGIQCIPRDVPISLKTPKSILPLLTLYPDLPPHPYPNPNPNPNP